MSECVCTYVCVCVCVFHVAVQVLPKDVLVEQKTEDVFTSSFWRSQTFITNALDNIKARLYVDQQCVLYQKPLLESGTQGAKCNSQVHSV